VIVPAIFSILGDRIWWPSTPQQRTRNTAQTERIDA